MVYVGQGDSIFVQFPNTYRTSDDEPIEMLVDGGPGGQPLPVFLDELYDAAFQIEYGVISHHDLDHVRGITNLLKTDDIGLTHLYHNGLASWRGDAKGFANLDPSDTGLAVFTKKDGEIDRGMAVLRADGFRFRAPYLIDNKSDLLSALNNDELHNVYEALAAQVRDKTEPGGVDTFPRARLTNPFLEDLPAPSAGNEITFELFWPPNPPERFGPWSESINGNSVTFKLVYGDFEMLFTGDHNDASEEGILDAIGDSPELEADVLKVPHHGSGHQIKAFFDAVNPVVSVASMGNKGFSQGWKHPSEKVVEWAGGHNRIYHTYIHERVFTYDSLTTQERESMIETTHILIETDGEWFRITELDNPNETPTVAETTRGNGTRWVRAD